MAKNVDGTKRKKRYSGTVLRLRIDRQSPKADQCDEGGVDNWERVEEDAARGVIR